MSYRPEGWVNPYVPKEDEPRYMYEPHPIIFEEGADAMLKALKEKGLKIPKDVLIPSIAYHSDGTLVFIPDDEEQDYGQQTACS